MDNEKIEKKLKKIIDEEIISNKENLENIFSEEEVAYAIKHRNKIEDLLLCDSSLKKIIESEIVDYIDSYLTEKFPGYDFNKKTKKSKRKIK